MHAKIFVLSAMLAVPSVSWGQFWVDFNSNQGGGGTPVFEDPTDPTNAAFQEEGFLCYHALHENIDSFLPATYSVDWAQTGVSEVTMTPEWPNTEANTVRQSIGRSQGQADTWLGQNVNLLRDWIGADSRTGNVGNGAWDGTTGTPTYFQLRFADLPQATYEMTAFFHDVEHMMAEFSLEVSTDGGETFADPILGQMTNSLSGGNPAENEVLPGEEPNVAEGDPAELSSTQVFTFDAVADQEVVLRFAPFANGVNVHTEFVGLNGFKMEQGDASSSLGLAITKVDRNPDTGEVELTWNSKEGKTYAIRSVDVLTGDPGSWPVLTTGVASGGEQTSYTDTTAEEIGERYYVVEEL